MAINRFSQSTAQSAFPKFTNLWDGTTATSAFDSLGSVLLSTAASTVTFSNIPQTYTHLQIRSIAKNVTTGSADYDSLRMTVNSDTSSNYSTHYIQTQAAASVGASWAASASNYYAGGICRSGTGQTSAFSGLIVDILDYQNTSKYKTFRGLSGTEYNGTYAFLLLTSGSWRSTSAITSISFAVDTAVNIAQYSEFSLYGIK